MGMPFYATGLGFAMTTSHKIPRITFAPPINIIPAKHFAEGKNTQTAVSMRFLWKSQMRIAYNLSHET